ncbi:Beta amylase [Carpediemonas membranifera]|uniref:Beta-amylase n=1 Tax=Carpediemonas membranifera TaxID=201153 RepID=A0A8J6BFN3_9EUKA|nr:Beta amylase [Carpediemonas membranifera]|eukprot:KAG9396477.1 Beta amylase [Carpediemonas membranifera]
MLRIILAIIALVLSAALQACTIEYAEVQLVQDGVVYDPNKLIYWFVMVVALLDTFALIALLSSLPSSKSSRSGRFGRMPITLNLVFDQLAAVLGALSGALFLSIFVVVLSLAVLYRLETPRMLLISGPMYAQPLLIAVIFAVLTKIGQIGVKTAKKPVCVNVMLPLDIVDHHGNLSNPTMLRVQLESLKRVGTSGVMADVWWGIVEYLPAQYNWRGYLGLAQMCKEVGLKLQFVVSFHACGGNVGDVVDVPLPRFVLDVAATQGLFYQDVSGTVDKECLSLSADHEAKFPGRREGETRTALQMYEDFMTALADTFIDFMPRVITEVEVGLGPAGELRYPSYIEARGWAYPGIGQFQTYDVGMLRDLASEADDANRVYDWGFPPKETGHYNSAPDDQDAAFFNEGGGYCQPHGRFFLEWYSSRLVEHGRDVLMAAKAAFEGCPVLISGKVSGIHWWYGHPSHAAELTTGYYNTDGRDTYLDIAQMMSDLKCEMIFTCMEMASIDHDAMSRPFELVEQVQMDCKQANISFSGENALPIHSWQQYQVVLKQVNNKVRSRSFTFLRLTDLLDDHQWQMYCQFVRRMNVV